jgi:hypothetical protein
MLLVIIAALLFERWHREREARRAEAVLQARIQQAEAEALRVRAFVNSGIVPIQQGTPNTGQDTGTGVR